MIKKIIEKDHKRIFFYGSEHSKSEEQIADIENCFLDFKPDLVMVEGNFNLSNFKTKEEFFEKGSEFGFVLYLCKKMGIKCLSNDPLNEECQKFVENKYGEDIAFLYFYLRAKIMVTEDDSDYLKVKKLFFKIFNKEIRFGEDYGDYFNPILNLNLFNKITRGLNVFRDDFMIRRIKDLIKEHDRIFVIKGYYHIFFNLDKLSGLLNERG